MFYSIVKKKSDDFALLEYRMAERCRCTSLILEIMDVDKDSGPGRLGKFLFFHLNKIIGA